MSEPSIHQLLGLPSDVTRPNAYQVFGLALGEADQQVIRAAIERRILTIKQAKSVTEPDVWMQAVRAVQAAQKVLVDPEQKAALDAKYGILNEPEPARSKPVAPAAAADPLAALLPGSQSNLGSSPLTPSESVPSTLLTGKPHTQAIQPNSASTSISGVQVTDDRRARRRRGSGGLLLGSIVVAMLGLIVAGLAFMYLNGGNIQLVKSSDGFQVNSGSAAKPGVSRVAAPQATPKDPRGDGIMKPPSTIQPPATNSPQTPIPEPAIAEIPISEMPAMDAPMTETSGEMAGMGTDMMSSPDMPVTPPMTSPLATIPPGPMVPPVPVITPGPELAEEQMAAGESAIMEARQAVVAADWANMKTLCETAEKKAVTDEQKQTAETLYQFADLAVHYRSAIQKAMAELIAGNEFQLTDSMTFLVQKSSAQQITLYRNKRAYSYTLDDLPLSVAHALAPFGMNTSSPEGQAAEAVFQVISPKTTPGHRAQSIDILRGLTSVQDADPQKIADFVASLGAP